LIVIDASAALELLLNSSSSTGIADRIFAPGVSLNAPHIIDLEVAQVLRRYALAGDLSPRRASQALEDFSDLAVHRYAHADLMPRIWALRNSLSAYDAAYVSLAEALDAPLLTADKRMGRSHGHRARIDIV
jgi:predicted nucleic acid-binding protein